MKHRSGILGFVGIDLHAAMSDKKVLVVNDESKKDLQFLQDEPLVLSNPYAKLITQGNEFKCKGKHQYKAKGAEWVCQCGRKL